MRRIMNRPDRNAFAQQRRAKNGASAVTLLTGLASGNSAVELCRKVMNVNRLAVDDGSACRRPRGRSVAPRLCEAAIGP